MLFKAVYVIMNKIVILFAFLLLTLLTVFSCAAGKDPGIVKVYDTAEEAGEACCLMPVEYVPEGFHVSAYRTIYGHVSETEYKSEDAVKDGEKIAVLRIVSTEYKTENLSGFTDMGLVEVFSPSDKTEFEIETRDGVYAAEWTETFGGDECNISFTLINGENIEEFKKLLEESSKYIENSHK